MRLVSLATAAALTLLGVSPLRAQDAAQRDSVLAPIHAFLAGLRTRDTAAMAAQMDTLTRVTLLRPAPAGGVRVIVLRGADFIRVASNPSQPPIDEPIRNPVVQIDGPLATVWAEYQVRREGRVTHCGFDAFHLAKLDGRWKILNVSDSYRQAGCGEPWP